LDELGEKRSRLTFGYLSLEEKIVAYISKIVLVEILVALLFPKDTSKEIINNLILESFSRKSDFFKYHKTLSKFVCDNKKNILHSIFLGITDSKLKIFVNNTSNLKLKSLLKSAIVTDFSFKIAKIKFNTFANQLSRAS